MATRIGLELSQASFASQPGGEAAVATLVVRNTGELVEHIRLRVEGLEPAWWALSEADVSLLPDTSAWVQLTIRPPAEATAGSHPFRVVAAGGSDTDTHTAEATAMLEVDEV